MATSSKIWILKSSDGETFEVDEAVASQAVTIKGMIEEFTDEDSVTVTLPNVNGNILAKVIEYCKKHVDTPCNADANAIIELKKFDTEFVKLDLNALVDLILAANYLDIPGLLALLSQAIADIVQDWKPEKIRKVFNIDNDFTKEEEDALRKENPWAYDL